MQTVTRYRPPTRSFVNAGLLIFACSVFGPPLLIFGLFVLSQVLRSFIGGF